MPTFRYQALSSSGETLAGSMEAARAEEVVARLQEQGHLPVSVADGTAGSGEPGLLARFRARPLDEAAVLSFTQQLATLLGAGQPLDRALGHLVELPERPAGRRVVERIRDAVRGGLPLSAALEQQHGLFPRLYVNLVRAGEAGGGLQPALARLADHLERAAALRAQLVSALVYPMLLLVMVVAVCVLLLAFVVPQFDDLLRSAEVSLPWYTEAVLAVGRLLRVAGLPAFVLAAVAALLLLRHLRRPGPRAALDAWLLGRPRIGALLSRFETARLARTLGTLLGNGVPLLAALGIARQSVGNRVLGEAVEAATEAVKAGQGLGPALARAQCFPRLAVQMVQVGEESGELAAMLLKVADTFDTETRRALERALAALVPVVTVLMAALVGIVILAVLVPIYQLTGSAGVL